MTTTNGVTYTYNWLHIPTGKMGTARVSEDHLINCRYKTIYEAINSWNCSLPGIWQYWINASDALGVYS